MFADCCIKARKARKEQTTAQIFHQINKLTNQQIHNKKKSVSLQIVKFCKAKIVYGKFFTETIWY